MHNFFGTGNCDKISMALFVEKFSMATWKRKKYEYMHCGVVVAHLEITQF